ncbi:unnamed protein product, partial [Mesorhabditis spiculigera]
MTAFGAKRTRYTSGPIPPDPSNRPSTSKVAEVDSEDSEADDEASEVSEAENSDSEGEQRPATSSPGSIPGLKRPDSIRPPPGMMIPPADQALFRQLPGHGQFFQQQAHPYDYQPHIAMPPRRTGGRRPKEEIQ